MHLGESVFLSQLEFKIYSQVEIPGCSVYQNARTNQMMPMNIEVLEDMEINKESTVCLMLVKSFKFVFDYSRNK
jgi:hypothetical protein